MGPMGPMGRQIARCASAHHWHFLPHTAELWDLWHDLDDYFVSVDLPSGACGLYLVVIYMVHICCLSPVWCVEDKQDPIPIHGQADPPPPPPTRCQPLNKEEADGRSLGSVS